MWTCFSSLLNYTFNFSYPLEWLYSSSLLLLMVPHVASIPHTASVPHIVSTSFPFCTSFHSTVSLRAASIFPFPKLAGFPSIHPKVKPIGGEIFNQHFGASLLNKNLGHTYLWGAFNTKKKETSRKKNEFKLIAQTAGRQPNNFRQYIPRDQRWHCVLGTTRGCCKKELLEIEKCQNKQV